MKCNLASSRIPQTSSVSTLDLVLARVTQGGPAQLLREWSCALCADVLTKAISRAGDWYEHRLRTSHFVSLLIAELYSDSEFHTV